MSRKYTYEIECTLRYYGYPQAERHYIIKSDYLEMVLYWYGCHGFDIPKVVNNHQLRNGYFWGSQAFMGAMYKDKLRLLSDLRENETRILVIDEDSDKIYWKGGE